MSNNKKTAREFVLASSSVMRRTLLESAGIVPDTILGLDIDETPFPKELPSLYVKRIAHMKSEAALRLYPQCVNLTADTTVAVGRRFFQKPATEEEAGKMLDLYSGRRHRIYTHVVVSSSQHQASRTVITTVTFKKLSSCQRRWYLNTSQWEGNAGGLCLEGAAAGFIKRLNGSFTNCLGLPLYESLNMLQSFGIIPQEIHG